MQYKLSIMKSQKTLKRVSIKLQNMVAAERVAVPVRTIAVTLRI